MWRRPQGPWPCSLTNIMLVRARPPVDPAWRPDPTILLQPGLVKPLHGMNPRTIRGQQWWDGERRAAYRSTGYRCLACAVTNVQLEAHEQYAIDFAACRYRYERAVPLCHRCHQYIHLGRCEMLVRQGQMPAEEFVEIQQHGDTILAAAHLSKDAHLMRLCGGDARLFFPEETGTWARWHLRLDSRDYYSRFKDVDEWARHYAAT